MKRFKHLLKSPAVHHLMVKIIALYIRIVFVTTRKRYDVHPDSARYLKGEDNAIYSFWHGRMMLMPCMSPKNRRMQVLISLHRDGVLISEVMNEFKFKTIAGSSSKGGREALMAILRGLKAGDNIAITPDGPRGPYQVAASGVASAAKLSGKPIIPITFAASHCKRARSWDKFIFALPFSRIIFCVGAPVMIDKSMPEEESRIFIERIMNQQTEVADAAIL